MKPVLGGPEEGAVSYSALRPRNLTRHSRHDEIRRLIAGARERALGVKRLRPPQCIDSDTPRPASQ